MAPRPRSTSVVGPATLILTHGHARADGMASASIGAGYAVVIPGFDQAVTVLPGPDAREVLRAALEDAITFCEQHLADRGPEDDARLRAYLGTLQALEDSLPEPLALCDQTVTSGP